MKIKEHWILLIVTAVFAALVLGFFLGRNLVRPAVTTQRIAPTVQTLPETLPTEAPEPTEPETTACPEPAYPLDLNTATARDFTFLPGIGEVLAQRIVDYRETNGNFTELTDLLNVEGIGEKKLAEMLPYITIGG